MPAPTQATYSTAITAAFGNSVKTFLDAGAGPAYINIRSATDVQLAQVLLTDPCGAVSGTTGQLTLTPAGTAVALVDGTAAYAQLCDSTGLVHLALPALAGTVAVPGYVVINSLVLLGGAQVTLASVVVG